MRSDASMQPPENVLPESLTAERILRAAQAAQLYGVSIATFRRLKRAGKLPPSLQLSERRIGWRVRDLIEHLKAQPLADDHHLCEVSRRGGRRRNCANCDN
jgi:predicted DNA-binding transcriptional regulator AlpA